MTAHIITSLLLALSVMVQSAFSAEATKSVAIPEISAITAAMQGVVANQEVAGAVTLVASPDKIVHLSAVGFADIAANRPMKTDSIFWIASMTKPVTAAAILMLQDEGKLVEQGFGNFNPENHDRYPAPNGGLFSTATDYARFLQMLLNSGTLEGRTYLKPETVKLMAIPQTGDFKTGWNPGHGWGLGVAVLREPQGVTATLSPGTFGHVGVYGTHGWIDPGKKRVHVLMIQRTDGGFDDSAARRAFHTSFAAWSYHKAKPKEKTLW